MVIANSAASAPEMMMGNSHSHAYKGKYQGKIIDCVPSERPFITTAIWSSSGSTAAISVTFGQHPPTPTHSSSDFPYPQPIMAQDLTADSCGKALLISGIDSTNLSRSFIRRSIASQPVDDDDDSIALVFCYVILNYKPYFTLLEQMRRISDGTNSLWPILLYGRAIY